MTQVALLDDPGTQRQLVAALPSGVLPASNSTVGSATLKPLGAADLEGDEKVDKRGAGLMLACVLLLLFNFSNPSTLQWVTMPNERCIVRSRAAAFLQTCMFR